MKHRRLLCVIGLFAVVGSLSAAQPGVLRGEGEGEGRGPDLPGWMRPDDLSPPAVEVDSLRWLDNFEFARMSANAQGNSMLVLFASPTCMWCRRLKAETLSDPDLRDRLRRYTLVEINTERTPSLGMRYGIRGVPALVWMDAEGRELHRVGGFLSAEDLGAVLDQMLSPGGAPEAGVGRHAALLRDLEEKEPDAELMARAIRVMHQQDPGGRVREALRKIDPVPADAWVELLPDRSLVVRLGALELLEELAGTSFGFDPWAAPGAPETRAALTRWREWREDTPDIRPRFARLTREQFEDALRDLEHGTAERVHRAMRTLEIAGPTLRKELEARMEREDLSEVLRARLEELMLTLDVARLGWADATGIAHRLRRGPLDTRLHLLREVVGRGRAGLPVLAAFVDDPEILIRETAIEGLLVAGGAEALPLVLPHLEEESSIDVAVTAMRNMGKLVTPASTAWLKSQLASGNEERILGALNAVREGAHLALIPEALKLLEDSRWRVRAEVARTMQATRSRQTLPTLLKHVEDSDEFARTVLLEACISLAESASRRQTMLEGWWEQFPEDQLMLLRIACGNRVSPPAEFLEGLEEHPREELLTILGIIEDCREQRRDVGLRLAGHRDEDVRAAALRLLARRGLEGAPGQRREVEGVLAKALLEGDSSFRLMLVDSLVIPREESRSFGGGMDPFSGFFARSPARSGAAEIEFEEADEELDELLGAFAGPGEAASEMAAEETEEAGASLEDLMGAFESAEPKGGVASAEGGRHGLKPVLQRIFEEESDPALRQVSARVLLELGEDSVLPYVLEEAAGMPEEHLARLLGRPGNDELIVRAAKSLLSDSRPDVRRQAVLQLASRDMVGSFLPLIDTFGEGEHLLRLEEILWDRHQLRSALRELRGPQVRSYVEKWLGHTDPQSAVEYTQVSLGLLLVATTRERRHEAAVRELVESLVDPALRGQAWLSLAALRFSFSPEEMAELGGDPAAEVRALAPFFHMRSDSKSRSWRLHPEMAIEVPARDAGNGWTQRLGAEGEQLLTSLLEDPMPEVRLYAGAALITQLRPMEDPESWLASLPDADAGGREFARNLWSSVQNQLHRLGPEYGPLMDWFERQEVRNAEQSIGLWRRTRGGASTAQASVEEEGETREIVLAEGASEEDEEVEEIEIAPATSEEVTLVYMYSPGCPECEVVREILSTYRSIFPDLRIRAVDVSEAGAMDLYYAIYQKFDLPLTQVGLTPMLAGSGGADCGGEALTYDRIGDLIARSLDEPGEDWIPEVAEVESDAVSPSEDVSELEGREVEEAAAPVGEESASLRLRVPATPLQGLLLLAAVPLVLRLHPPRAGVAAIWIVGGVLLCVILPLALEPVMGAVLLMVLFLVLAGEGIPRKNSLSADTLSTRIRETRREVPPALFVLGGLGLLLIGFSISWNQGVEALSLLPVWAWVGILGVAVFQVLPGRRLDGVRPLLAPLTAAGLLLGGVLGL